MEMLGFEGTEDLLNRCARNVGGIVALCGLLWRLYNGSHFYLNPDEAMHFTVAADHWHGLMGFYRNATRLFHPPLFIPVLQGMLVFGRSEWILRLVPAISGALFPWLIALWVQRLTGSAAALCAQLLLTFSPALISLGAEVRAYTLAFLFLSICLLLLDEALEHGSSRYMAWFHVFLCLAILTEYCVAWFVVSLGIYALLRLSMTPTPRSLRTTWILGQAVALSLYAFLYFTQIARPAPDAGLTGLYSTWLSQAFPQSHQHLLVFALKGTYRQFTYLLQLRLLAAIAVIAFPFGLYRLWKDKSPLHALLLVLPFCVACLGAIFHLFPYGDTRHTAFLGLSIAAVLGTAIARMARNRMLPILILSLPMIFIWNTLAPDPSLTVPRYRHHLSAMHDAVQFLGNSVPPGSVIVTDAGTDLTMGYYLGCPDYAYDRAVEPYRMRECARLHFVIAPTFEFGGIADLTNTLAHVQAKYHLQQPAWVVAGGFSVHVANPASEVRPFGQTLAIFKDSDLPPTSVVGP
jgi:4-amino-4-deoxy-L-arabinose transferase-like glycosyltransferase